MDAIALDCAEFLTMASKRPAVRKAGGSAAGVAKTGAPALAS